jgi:hypothetical protein
MTIDITILNSTITITIHDNSWGMLGRGASRAGTRTAAAATKRGPNRLETQKLRLGGIWIIFSKGKHDKNGIILSPKEEFSDVLRCFQIFSDVLLPALAISMALFQ